MRKFEIVGFVTGLLTRFRIFASLAIATAILMQTAGAFAYDAPFRTAAGGIEFKNEHIRILEQAIEISQYAVHVKYRFLNESDKDIHTKVTFPLPGYNPFSPHADSRPPIDTPNVWVNGRLMATEYVRKAVVVTNKVKWGPYRENAYVITLRDVTPYLRERGLSDDEIFDKVHLTDDQQASLKLEDTWGVEETVSWQQDFPAHRETVIEHEYTPAAGDNYYIPYQRGSGLDSGQSVSSSGVDQHEPCLDDRTSRAIHNRIKAEAAKDPETLYLTIRDVEYILGTGRNWKGPIGEFTLRIKKEKPDEFVSLCFPGKPKKVGPAEYEFHEKDYVPPDKLVVYFYTVRPEVAQ